MSRYITCKINGQYELVWKYVFSIQDSEMCRINTELGIGEYHIIRYVDDDETECSYEYVSEDDFLFDPEDDFSFNVGDILILNRSDVEKLQTQLQSLKNADKLNTKDKWFIAMIESILDFITEYSDQEQFILEGEFF